MNSKKGRPRTKEPGLSADDQAVWSASLSPFVRVCKTREDLEVAARRPMSDERWEKLKAKADARGLTVGEHLYTAKKEYDAKLLRERADNALNNLFFRPDGTARSEAEVDAILESSEREARDQKMLREVEQLERARARMSPEEGAENE